MRQNYVEADVGDAKADGLAQRLRAISDDVEVEIRPSMLPEDWRDAASADLVVDATISHALSQFTETLATDPDRNATIAQVATDARTGNPRPRHHRRARRPDIDPRRRQRSRGHSQGDCGP